MRLCAPYISYQRHHILFWCASAYASTPQATHAESQAQLSTAHSEASGYRDALRRSESQRINLADQIDESKQDLRILELTNAELLSSQRALSAELEASKAATQRARAEAATAAQDKASAVATRQANAAQREEVENLKAQLDAAHAARRADAAEAAKQLHALKLDLAEEQQRLVKARDDAAVASEEALRCVQQVEKTAAREADTIRANAQYYEQDAAKHKEAAAALKSQVESLEQDLETAEYALATAESRALEQQRDAEAQMESAANAQEVTSAALSQALGDRDDARRDVNRLNNRMYTLEAEMEELSRDAAAELASLEAAHDTELRAAAAEVERAQSNMTNATSKHEDTARSLKSMLQGAHRQVSDLQETLEEKTAAGTKRAALAVLAKHAQQRKLEQVRGCTSVTTA